MSILVVLVLLSPLVLIVFQAVQAGWSQIWPVLDRAIVVTLLWNTVRLAVAVTALCAVIGTGAAWLTERTALPGRRAWAVALIVPIVIPDFVLSWAWSSVFPAVQGYFGAVLVMVLHLYPLVYLPMAAAFRAADPGQEEAARSLGLSEVGGLAADQRAPGPVRPARRLPAGLPVAAGLLRRLRGPALPDVHHGDLR